MVVGTSNGLRGHRTGTKSKLVFKRTAIHLPVSPSHKAWLSEGLKYQSDNAPTFKITSTKNLTPLCIVIVRNYTSIADRTVNDNCCWSFLPRFENFNETNVVFYLRSVIVRIGNFGYWDGQVIACRIVEQVRYMCKMSRWFDYLCLIRL